MVGENERMKAEPTKTKRVRKEKEEEERERKGGRHVRHHAARESHEARS